MNTRSSARIAAPKGGSVGSIRVAAGGRDSRRRLYFLFRTQIGRFLDRTKSIGTHGLRAYDDDASQQQHAGPATGTTTKPDALGQFLESFHSPLLLEVEATVDEEIKKRGLTDLSAANKALRKSLAGIIILWQFEKLYNIIWQSQVAALIFLNGRAAMPTPEAELERFYVAGSEAYPNHYQNYTFQNWLQFLVANVLIVEGKDGASITVATNQEQDLTKAFTGHNGIDTRSGLEIAERRTKALRQSAPTNEDATARYLRHRDILDYFNAQDKLQHRQILEDAVREKDRDFLDALATAPRYRRKFDAALLAAAQDQLAADIDPDIARLTALRLAYSRIFDTARDRRA